MPIKYVFPTFSWDHKNANPMRVFTSRLVKLEKLQNEELHANEIVANQ
jgi:hypothetical protein